MQSNTRIHQHHCEGMGHGPRCCSLGRQAGMQAGSQPHYLCDLPLVPGWVLPPGPCMEHIHQARGHQEEGAHIRGPLIHITGISIEGGRSSMQDSSSTTRLPARLSVPCSPFWNPNLSLHGLVSRSSSS